MRHGVATNASTVMERRPRASVRGHSPGAHASARDGCRWQRRLRSLEKTRPTASTALGGRHASVSLPPPLFAGGKDTRPAVRLANVLDEFVTSNARNRGSRFEEVAEPAGKPGSVWDSHSSRRSVTAELKQPTRTRRGPRHEVPIWPCSRWGLPCHATLAPHAVRSYRTISPLPRTSEDAVRRFAFCCTSRRLAPPRRYLAPCPVEPGLSSAPLRVTRLSGRLRRLHSTGLGSREWGMGNCKSGRP